MRRAAGSFEKEATVRRRGTSRERARTQKERPNPRDSYFTVCQAVTGFLQYTTDKHLAKKNCAHQNGSAAAAADRARRATGNVVARYRPHGPRISIGLSDTEWKNRRPVIKTACLWETRR